MISPDPVSKATLIDCQTYCLTNDCEMFTYNPSTRYCRAMNSICKGSDGDTSTHSNKKTYMPN